MSLDLDKLEKVLDDALRADEELAKEFERETGEETVVIVTDGVHVVGIKTTNYRYVSWLASRVISLRLELNALNKRTAEGAPTDGEET